MAESESPSPQPLSAREREIARLAVDGLTCGEMAKHLFVSVNTVKTHLRHVYSKIGVNSRIRLARRLDTGDRLEVNERINSSGASGPTPLTRQPRTRL